MPKDVAIAFPSLILGNYEPAVTKAIQSIQKPIHVAYDIGAHVGLTSLVLVKVFEGNVKVIAFEPAKGNISTLVSLIAANPGVPIFAMPLALSDCIGEMTFYHFQESSMGLLHTIASQDGTNIDYNDNEIVQTTTLDAYVLDEGHPPPGFIKIDVEGAECLVLAGGLRTISVYRPALLIELHGPEHGAGVYDLLADMAYRWTYIKPNVGPVETISERSHLLSYFGPGDKWTQHVLLQ